MAVRLVRPEDAAVLAELNARAWRTAYGAFVADAVMAPVLAQLPERWTQGVAATDGRETWVTYEVDGWVTVGPSRDDGAPGDEGELWALYVDPDLVGAGVGHGLHQFALTRLRALGFERAALWSFEANTRALEFYERHGWTRDARPFDGDRWDWARCARLVRDL